eukprot:PhF_6_TR19180/c0_g1_i1/m.28208/K10249/ELOVL4; elongation of very long chain fatty acids protein 4
MNRTYPWRQLPANISLSDPTSFWEWCLSVADPRVESWLLMSTPLIPWSLCVLYLMVVFFGCRFMTKREALDCTRVMQAYNVIVIGINFYTFVGVVYQVYKLDYGVVCNAMVPSPEGDGLARVLHIFFLSKLFDFSDTLFMIARKKFDQITFLHVYHHCFTAFIWWTGVKWAPGGDSYFIAMWNSFVHVVMYAYYLAVSFGWRTRHKYLITLLQLVQFFVVLTHTIVAVVWDCPYPHWMYYTLLAFLITMIILFGNFALREYGFLKSGRRKPKNQ